MGQGRPIRDFDPAFSLTRSALAPTVGSSGGMSAEPATSSGRTDWRESRGSRGSWTKPDQGDGADGRCEFRRNNHESYLFYLYDAPNFDKPLDGVRFLVRLEFPCRGKQVPPGRAASRVVRSGGIFGQGLGDRPAEHPSQFHLSGIMRVVQVIGIDYRIEDFIRVGLGPDMAEQSDRRLDPSH